uniref:CHRD domain-containing protein n=1 Tax=Stieleria sp. TaxID=2795976 RepID=UPI003563B869
ILGGTQSVAMMRTFGADNADFTAAGYELFRIQISELTSGLSLNDVSIRSNSASGDQATDGGGGIYNAGGTVNIDGGDISGNAAIGGSASGGGIFNSGTLTVQSASISSNTANRAGGGIESTAGSSTALTGVNLDDNTAGPAGMAAPGNGGGLHITGNADATITGGTVSGNFAASEGGGLWNGSGTLTIDGNTAIADNIAAGSQVDQGGGGIFNAGGTVQVSDATIADNVAAGATTFALSGSQEVPPVNTTAFGEANLVFDAESESFRLDLFVSGIELTDESDLPQLTGAHIHLQASGANGPVIVNLGTDQWISEETGIRLRLDDVAFPNQNIAALLAAGAYINVHSSANPSGEVRGQIVFPTPMGSGGGVLNDGGSVSITDSTISGNVASRAGGGIEATPGSVTTLIGVNLDDNIAGPAGLATPGNGGGLHITGDADATITGGSVSGNVAASEGGGLWNGSGTMSVEGTSIIGNVAQGSASHDGGGGIFNNGGDLLISDTTISGNLADGESGSGGGLFNLAGNVTVSNSSFEFNGANRAGGGIEIVDGTVTLTDSHLINNDVDGTATNGSPSPGNGGGLHVTGVADVTLTGGTVFGNVAASEGGGLWNQAGSTLTVDGTLVSGNSAFGDDADNGGGGLFNNGGTLVLRNATVSENFADGENGSGGGILNVSGGTVSITDSSITGNVASRAGGGIEDASEAGGDSVDGPSLTLNNVILEGNNAGVLDDGFGGGSLFASPGNGGGIHITGSADVLIIGGRVERNIAAREGGGLWNGSGTMTIDGTSIAENTASGDSSDDGGGGIFNNGGDLVITAATIVGNVADGTAGSGGGILNAGGELRLENLVLSGNVANRAGGGIEQSGDSAFLELLDVTFESNVAGPAGSASPGNGGGLHIGDAGNGFIRRGVFTGNTAARDGGGIWNGAGSLTVIDTLINQNIAMGDQPGQGGGGIYNLGTLTFTRGEILDNEAIVGLGNGGGILNAPFANGSIGESTINENAAARAGGAIENFGNLLIGNSTLAENSAGINGGALHISGFGIAIFTGSTIRDNSAVQEGGGLWNSADGLIAVQTSLVAGNTATDGGGLFNDGTDGDIRLVNSTVSGNVASGMGGGIRSEGGEVLLTSVTIADNVAAEGGGVDIASGTTTLSSSIIGDNSATTAPDIRGQILSEGFNVIGNTDGAVLVATDASDRLNVDPGLDILADNGGRTLTHALLADSPAINNGNPDGVPADQRLTSRPQGPGTDSGAYESDLVGGPFPSSPLAADVNGDGVATPLDALRVINFLALESDPSAASAESERILAGDVLRMDVNGDDRITPLDALMVINHLARQNPSELNAELPPGTSDAIDVIALEEIRRRRDEIDELLLEQLAVDTVAK